MNLLDPAALFERLCRELPATVRDHVVVVGSLAAAYHYRERLPDQGVRTKDADLVLQPRAVAAAQAASAARNLREAGWTLKGGGEFHP